MKSNAKQPSPDRDFSRLPDSIMAMIVAQVRGSYQADLITGDEAWSGSSLQGRARNWGARYAASRDALLDRIRASLPRGWDAATEIVGRRRLPDCHVPARPAIRAGAVTKWNEREERRKWNEREERRKCRICRS